MSNPLDEYLTAVKKLGYVASVPVELLIDEGMEPPGGWVETTMPPKRSAWRRLKDRATYKMWAVRRVVAKRIDPTLESYDDQGF